MTENRSENELPGWIAEHIEMYMEDPEKGHMWDSTSVGGPGILPTLLLSTKGRKSGATRVMPLIYGLSNGNCVVVASKGGAPSHPAWYLNLVDQPACEIQVAHDHSQVLARTAEGAEREALWNLMAEIYPPYNDYQAATEREIPVVVLQPRG